MNFHSTFVVQFNKFIFPVKFRSAKLVNQHNNPANHLFKRSTMKSLRTH